MITWIVQIWRAPLFTIPALLERSGVRFLLSHANLYQLIFGVVQRRAAITGVPPVILAVIILLALLLRQPAVTTEVPIDLPTASPALSSIPSDPLAPSTMPTIASTSLTVNVNDSPCSIETEIRRHIIIAGCAALRRRGFAQGELP